MFALHPYCGLLRPAQQDASRSRAALIPFCLVPSDPCSFLRPFSQIILTVWQAHSPLVPELMHYKETNDEGAYVSEVRFSCFSLCLAACCCASA